MPDLLEALPLLERFGGWIVVCAILYFGGRQFMAVARDFSRSVKVELGWINDKLGTMIGTMAQHEARLDSVDRSLDELRISLIHPARHHSKDAS